MDDEAKRKAAAALGCSVSELRDGSCMGGGPFRGGLQGKPKQQSKMPKSAPDSGDMEESRREAAIKLGLTPDQLKGLEAQATKPGEEQAKERPIVPDAKPLPQGDTGRYKWRQTPSELEIIVPIDETDKARDVVWKVTQTNITLGIKGKEVLKNARLYHEVKLGGSHTWQLDKENGQRCILATLEKSKLHEMWNAVEQDCPTDASSSAASMQEPMKAQKPEAQQPVAPPAVSDSPQQKSPVKAPIASSDSNENVIKELSKVEEDLRKVRAQIDAMRKQEESLLEHQKSLKAKLGQT